MMTDQERKFIFSNRYELTPKEMSKITGLTDDSIRNYLKKMKVKPLIRKKQDVKYLQG